MRQIIVLILILHSLNCNRNIPIPSGELRMTIEETLIKQYGPLLSLAQLAQVLDRKQEGLRITLRGSGDWVHQINAAKIRLGRRIYFRTSQVSNLLAGDQQESSGRPKCDPDSVLRPRKNRGDNQARPDVY